MTEIVDIAQYKADKLARIELEWETCLLQAEKLQKDGKFQFAKPLLEKAKALRETISKMRGPVPKQRVFDWTPVDSNSVTINIEPFEGLDNKS